MSSLLNPIRNRWAVVPLLAAMALSLWAAVALADNAVADGDGVVPLSDQNMTIGAVDCDVPVSKTAPVFISRQGSATSTNTFRNGAEVNITVASVTGAGLAATVPANNKIILPTNWTASTTANGTLSDAVNSTVTLTSQTAGPGTGTVTYRATGPNVAGTTITREDTMNVSWNTRSCAPPNGKPSVSVSGVTDGVSYEFGAVPAAGCLVTDAEDELAGSTTAATVKLSPLSGPDAAKGLGSQTATCTYIDAGGLSDTASATYSIVDTTAPALTVPEDITKDAGSADGAAVEFTATATDAVDGSPQVSCTPQSGATFPLGTTSVSCTAKDFAGNISAAKTFNVSVADKTAPTVTVPEKITAEATSAAGAVVTFEASATDAVDSSPQVSCTPPSGATFVVGTTTVSCTAKDAAGNTSEAKTFDVTVSDTVAPKLTVPADIVAEATSDAGAAVTFAATAEDAVDPNPTLTCDPASGGAFPLGVTTVSCTAQDAAGNVSEAKTFTITVKDTTAPVLTVPADIAKEATSAAGAVVSYSATAQDAVDGAPSVSCTPASGATFAPGTTTVSCIATDAAGNKSAAKTFKVAVSFNLKGFLAPVDNASTTTLNVAKGGSTVPLKFQVLTAGGYISDLSIVSKFTAGLVSCDSSDVPEDVLTTTGSTALRYDATANQFLQNWQTPKTVGKCYRAAVTFTSGQTLTADFRLK